MDLFGDFWYVWVLPFVGGIIWYLITKAARGRRQALPVDRHQLPHRAAL